jgi:hypothetical protein
MPKILHTILREDDNSKIKMWKDRKRNQEVPGGRRRSHEHLVGKETKIGRCQQHLAGKEKW